MYIKTFDADDTLTGAEYLADPCFVRWQAKNGMMVRCDRDEAQGVIGEDNNTVYLIGGAMPHGVKEPYAEEISKSEYDAIKRGEPDPEDDDPVDPDPENPPMTRAELTARVAELSGQNAMLTECLLEMSEIVYGNS